MLNWCVLILSYVSAYHLTGHRQGNKQESQNTGANIHEKIIFSRAGAKIPKNIFKFANQNFSLKNKSGARTICHRTLDKAKQLCTHVEQNSESCKL